MADTERRSLPERRRCAFRQRPGGSGFPGRSRPNLRRGENHCGNRCGLRRNALLEAGSMRGWRPDGDRRNSLRGHGKRVGEAQRPQETARNLTQRHRDTESFGQDLQNSGRMQLSAACPWGSHFCPTKQVPWGPHLSGPQGTPRDLTQRHRDTESFRQDFQD